VRLTREIERFLTQMELEHDWTPRTLDSYGCVLHKLCDLRPVGLGTEVRLHEFEGRAGTNMLREHIGRHWGTRVRAGGRM
jgi:hypothetical protein